jgi:hypothetical protein
MNLRHMKEHIAAVVAQIAKDRGVETNIIVSHNVVHRDMALLRYQTPDNKKDVRFVKVEANPQGKRWTLTFCFNLQGASDGSNRIEVAGDEIVPITAVVIRKYLDDGVVPEEQTL